MVAILTGVRWNPSMVLMCISFLVRDGEHFSMCFFGHLDFLEKFCLVLLSTSLLVH
jgi:hypothetical protein